MMAKDILNDDLPNIFFYNTIESEESVKNYYFNYEKAKEVEIEFEEKRNKALYESKENYYKKLEELGIEFIEEVEEDE